MNLVHADGMNSNSPHIETPNWCFRDQKVFHITRTAMIYRHKKGHRIGGLPIWRSRYWFTR